MSEENQKRNLEIKAFYLAGGSRSAAIEKWGITTNQMAGVQTRLNMHWSWPLVNRRSGIEPLGGKTQSPTLRSSRPRKGDRGGGVIHSIKAQGSSTNIPESDLKVPPDAPLYETPSPMRRYYGHSTRLSSREKYERGLVDKDSSIDRSAAFDGIDPEVVAAFAPFYK